MPAMTKNSNSVLEEGAWVPFFMIGIQRSGSNLLRLMLNELPDIAAPHPPHILQRMMPLLPHYGDLSDPDNFALLVDDVCRLVELNPVPWDGVTLNRADVAARCLDWSPIAVYGAVYDILAEVWGRRTWLCKSLMNIEYLDQIESYFGASKYIYLHRDGRDVAVSFRRAPVGEKHFYHIAKQWDRVQRIALAARERAGSERFFSLSYEQLITDPEPVLRRLCDFLGAQYSDAMLHFYQSKEAERTAHRSALWENVNHPIMAGNSGKFLKQASLEDLRIFESAAGEMLDALGYSRLLQKGEDFDFTHEDIRRFDAENTRLKAEVRGHMNPEDIRQRDRQEALLHEIRMRGLQRREPDVLHPGTADAA